MTYANSPTAFARILADSVVFGPQLRLDTFPTLLERHMAQNPNTLALEAIGAELVVGDFRPEAVENFVAEVCRWGGYSGVAGRVLKRNATDRLTDAFRNAWVELQQDRPSVCKALEYLNQLQGLGTPSFASKHLRFLAPALCPVFDSVLHARLPYTFDGSGYAAFSNDCRWLASTLNEANLKCPMRVESGRWLAADVEAALYVELMSRRDK